MVTKHGVPDGMSGAVLNDLLVLSHLLSHTLVMCVTDAIISSV